MARWNPRNIPHWDQVTCPQCQTDLELQEDELAEGEIVSCTNCSSSFEVLTHPFELRRIDDSSPEPGTHRPAA